MGNIETLACTQLKKVFHYIASADLADLSGVLSVIQEGFEFASNLACFCATSLIIKGIYSTALLSPHPLTCYEIIKCKFVT